MYGFFNTLIVIAALGQLVQESVSKNEYESSKCKSESFQCKSGKCISVYLICDGIQHCQDGSDETVSACYPIRCPPYMFRCNYGACIKISSICNGVANCADGSDEPPINNCRIPSFIPNQTTTKRTTTLTPSTTKVYTPFNPRPGSTPSQATPTKAKPTPTSSTTKVYTPFNPQSTTPTITKPVTQSPSQVTTTSTETARSGWCQLPEVTKDHTYTINDCDRISNGTSCGYQPGESVPPLTSLTLQCNPDYYNRVSESTSTLCLDSKWTPPVVFCEECGLTNFQATVSDNSVPWLVAIYDAAKNFNICWGTLSTPYTVITAAHCVFDETNKVKKETSNFFIMIGKHLTSDAEDNDTKRYRIAGIHLVDDSFDGGVTDSKGNIAILEIDSKISYNNNVKPVCIDWANKINFTPNDGTRGMIPIWTINLQLAMGEIHPLQYIYVSNRYCRNVAKASRNILLSDDKFCVILDPGTVIDSGNGGNGYFISSPNKENNHLLGVVSSYFFDTTNTPVLIITEITSYRAKLKSIIDEVEERRRVSDAIDVRFPTQSQNTNKKPNVKVKG